MKTLFIGDVVGKPGRTAVKSLVRGIVEREGIDFVIANGENAAGGFGITEKTAAELFDCGVDVITTGNHVWDKKEGIEFLLRNDRVLRPINYPPGVPGFGSGLYYARGQYKVGIINISGRVFMSPVDCPFRTVLPHIDKLRAETPVVIIDFHGEATSEKIAFARYLDGKVTAVLGTHTHVQTADEQILPGRTAYITDVGMTGPVNSVIGINTEQIIDRFLYQLPMKYEIAKGPTVLSAVLVDVDNASGKALSIRRLSEIC